MRYELRKAGRGFFIRSLTTSELPKYLEHLLRLDSMDRRMRFGLAIGDTGILEHVQRIDLRSDYILALFDDASMSWLPRTSCGRATTISRNSPSASIGSGAAAE